MNVIFHPEVNKDIEEAKAWYGKRFVDDFWTNIRRIQKFPYIYQKLDGDVRRCVMRDFPYNILYLVEDNIQILVLRHQKRDPEYGRDRY
ncbi:MAG: type II toxin-antitoxin system RelE/ParE family toxin [Acidobacteriota bacterium]|nr:type II toxin-antitoxin system RelE/ParE family toxin [Acidobacteriota bacterium]